MESHEKFSLSESEDKGKRKKRRKRILLVGEGVRFGTGCMETADGEKMSYQEYATKVLGRQETQQYAKDVPDVIKEDKSNKRQSTRSAMNQKKLKNVKRKVHPIIDGIERLNKSGYTNQRTEEGLMLQELEKTRHELAKIYENKIREYISELGSEIYSISKSRKKIPTLGRYQMTLSILLAILLKPFNADELMKFLDRCILEFNPEIQYRFSNDKKKILHNLWVIYKDNPEKRYMRKFITIQGEVNSIVKDMRFSMNPYLMTMVAEDYHYLRRSWFVRLPKGEEHISEDALLRSLPELKTYVESSHGITTKSFDVITDDDGLTDELRKIKFDLSSNRREIEAKAREEFNITSYIKKEGIRRMPKGEFMGYVMAFNETIVMTKMEWYNTFLEKLKQWVKGKQSVSFREIHNSEMYNFFRKIEKPETPINRFLYSPKKSSKTATLGFHPIIGRIKDISHIVTMIYSAKEGHKLIDEYCTEGRALYDVEIEKVLYPERFVVPVSKDKETLEPEDLLKDVKTVELDTEDFEDIEVIDETELETETAPVEDLATGISKIADAINKIADNGIHINFNIGFGTKSEVNGQLKQTDNGAISKMTEVLEVVEHSNKGLEIALEKMGLVLDSVNELVSLLK